MTFDPNDKKHAQACRDLELITGVPFALTQAKTSIGPLWVYRACTKALPPNADVLNKEGFSPFVMKDSLVGLAESHARYLHNAMRLNKPYAELTQDKRCARIDILQEANGDFRGLLDLNAESKDERNALNIDTLRGHASKIEEQNNPPWWKPFSKKETYRPRSEAQTFTREFTQEERESIPSKKQERLEKIKTLDQAIAESENPANIGFSAKLSSQIDFGAVPETLVPPENLNQFKSFKLKDTNGKWDGFSRD